MQAKGFRKISTGDRRQTIWRHEGPQAPEQAVHDPAKIREGLELAGVFCVACDFPDDEKK